MFTETFFLLSCTLINKYGAILRAVLLYYYFGVMVIVALAGAGPAVVLSHTATMFLRPGAIFQNNPAETSTVNPFGNHSGGTAISVGASAMTGRAGGSGFEPHLPTFGKQQHVDPHFAPQVSAQPLPGHNVGWSQEQTGHPEGLGAAEALMLYFKVKAPAFMWPSESTSQSAFMCVGTPAIACAYGRAKVLKISYSRSENGTDASVNIDTRS